MPRGAGVYLDGALKGKTPLDLPATGDRHKLAIILPGYRMYRGEIEGTGRTTATLQKASPPHGPAGIKVKCKSKNRFYVTVDGVETGEICPTERINVDLGVHKVEVYDPISDAVTTHEVHVEDTHFSVRVKLEE